jgi:hypothetical protein
LFGSGNSIAIGRISYYYPITGTGINIDVVYPIASPTYHFQAGTPPADKFLIDFSHTAYNYSVILADYIQQFLPGYAIAKIYFQFRAQ